jgi:hypothetical protein
MFKKSKPKRNKRKSKNVVGDVHYIPVVHVVANKELKSYKKKKGNLSPRPVAIVKQNKDNSLSIAKITSKKPTETQKKKGYRTKLSTTKMKKDSWISTDTIDKSYHSGKKFKTSEPPLNKKRSSRVSKNDLKTRELIVKRKKSR